MNPSLKKFFIYVFSAAVFLILRAEFSLLFGQETLIPVEINGDQVEFLMEGNKVVAHGNVVITQGKTKLTADMVEFSRDTNLAIAEGNVILTLSQGKIYGEKLTYNFQKMTGDFAGAKLMAYPYYGSGETVEKADANLMVVKNGYMTTCDLSKPHYRLQSKRVEIYPGDKLIARNTRMLIGKTPVIYMPKYTQKLDGKPRVTYTPGYDKQWGMYLLTAWRFYFNDDFKGVLHVDAREKKDRATGVDIKYQMKNYGSGTVRTYYMNERTIASKHFYQPRPSPTIERERFKAEWRHQWEIDADTDLTLQYYKLSDNGFLKDYSKREFEKDSSPQSFFLLTRNLPHGTASFRTDVRVNRFVAALERLPEIRYDMSNQKIGGTGLYFKSENGFVNLNKKDASPTEVRKETLRLDSNNELSYPLKLAMFEMRPFVGERQTYYSRTIEPSRYDIVRGLFRTGVDLSTKFYKVLDVKTNFLGLDIHRLRHVITPSAAYEFSPRPTVPPSLLDSFDGVDSLNRLHNISFNLENKLQTKREGIATDLLRVTAATNFHLKENPSKGGFDRVRSDIEFKPTSWLTFLSDSDYDTYNDKISSVNFEFHINDTEKSKWSLDFGKRYTPEVDDQVTTEFNYRLNPKWKFRIYRRFDILHNLVKEQEYTVTRDLHCWEMDVNFNETRGSGSEIWIIFRLKAFPEMGLDFGTGFNKRKTGTQSSIGQ